MLGYLTIQVASLSILFIRFHIVCVIFEALFTTNLEFKINIAGVLLGIIVLSKKSRRLPKLNLRPSIRGV